MVKKKVLKELLKEHKIPNRSKAKSTENMIALLVKHGINIPKPEDVVEDGVLPSSSKLRRTIAKFIKNANISEMTAKSVRYSVANILGVEPKDKDFRNMFAELLPLEVDKLIEKRNKKLAKFVKKARKDSVAVVERRERASDQGPRRNSLKVRKMFSYSPAKNLKRSVKRAPLFEEKPKKSKSPEKVKSPKKTGARVEKECKKECKKDTWCNPWSGRCVKIGGAVHMKYMAEKGGVNIQKLEKIGSGDKAKPKKDKSPKKGAPSTPRYGGCKQDCAALEKWCNPDSKRCVKIKGAVWKKYHPDYVSPPKKKQWKAKKTNAIKLKALGVRSNSPRKPPKSPRNKPRSLNSKDRKIDFNIPKKNKKDEEDEEGEDLEDDVEETSMVEEFYRLMDTNFAFVGQNIEEDNPDDSYDYTTDLFAEDIVGYLIQEGFSFIPPLGRYNENPPKGVGKLFKGIGSDNKFKAWIEHIKSLMGNVGIVMRKHNSGFKPKSIHSLPAVLKELSISPLPAVLNEVSISPLKKARSYSPKHLKGRKAGLSAHKRFPKPEESPAGYNLLNEIVGPEIEVPDFLLEDEPVEQQFPNAREELAVDDPFYDPNYNTEEDEDYNPEDEDQSDYESEPLSWSGSSVD